MDSYTVQISPMALNDLDRIYTNIVNTISVPSIAQGIIEKIEQAIFSLYETPYRCAIRKVGKYADKGYRQLFVKNYTIVYRINEEEKKVIIITVRFSASEF